MVNIETMLSMPQETHPERLWVLSQLRVEDLIIYDLGCGKNKTLGRAIGVDILPTADMISVIDELPILSDSVDIIISRHSLEHLLDSIKALEEWKRVLKPNGKIIIVLPDHEYIDTMSPILSGGVHLHAFTRDSFKNLIEKISGLKIEKTETVVKDWSFGMVIKKIIYKW